MKNVVMDGTGVYIPPNKVYNEELDEHFEKIGLSAHSLMNHLGRRKRYFISEGENAITMIQNAIDNCMKRTISICKIMKCLLYALILQSICHPQMQ